MKKLFIAIFLTSLLLLCAGEAPKEKVVPKKTVETPLPAETPKPEKTPTEMQQLSRSECENCHNNPKRQYVPQAYEVEGHKNADYCISCHLKEYLNESKEFLLEKLHEKHVTQADCKVCHKEIGKSEWECLNCHGSDPFKPGRNLVDIHRARNVLCEDCHGEDYLRIHLEKKVFPYEIPPIPPKN